MNRKRGTTVLSDFERERMSIQLYKENDKLETTLAKDIHFMENIKQIGWRQNEQDRAVQLSGQGFVKYISGSGFGTWITTPAGFEFIDKNRM